MHGSGLKPAEIDNMTFPEILLWLDKPQEGERRPPPNAASGYDEINRYFERLSKMTPAERLADSIERHS